MWLWPPPRLPGSGYYVSPTSRRELSRAHRGPPPQPARSGATQPTPQEGAAGEWLFWLRLNLTCLHGEHNDSASFDAWVELLPDGGMQVRAGAREGRCLEGRGGRGSPARQALSLAFRKICLKHGRPTLACLAPLPQVNISAVVLEVDESHGPEARQVTSPYLPSPSASRACRGLRRAAVAMRCSTWHALACPCLRLTGLVGTRPSMPACSRRPPRCSPCRARTPTALCAPRARPRCPARRPCPRPASSASPGLPSAAPRASASACRSTGRA